MKHLFTVCAALFTLQLGRATGLAGPTAPTKSLS